MYNALVQFKGNDSKKDMSSWFPAWQSSYTISTQNITETGTRLDIIIITAFDLYANEKEFFLCIFFMYDAECEVGDFKR